MVQFQNNSGTLKGANGMRLAHGHSAFRRADANITVPLNAPDDPVSGYYSNSGTAPASSAGWFHLPRHVNDIPARPGRRPDHRGVRASRADLLAVLSDVRHALLRASYHADQVEGSLLRAALSCGSSGSSGLENSRVERCDCPPGYQGMSCERCSFGYVRAPSAVTGGGGGNVSGGGEEGSTTQHFECMRCNCNGHAATCDPQSGACSGRDCPYYVSGSESCKNGKMMSRKTLGTEDSQQQYPPCMHNTTGKRCDMCADGYHGNATRGAPSDCSRCSCPGDGDGGARSFSPRCENLRGGGYRCTQCTQGHAGDHCERNRQTGYRPPPIRMLSPPPVAPEVSWRSSGSDALSDAYNMCESGYFGKPMEGGQCEPCRCSGGTCDPDTGRCLQCPGNTEGWRCERCLPAHYGDPAAADCKPCNCYGPGSLTGESCDADNGQCMCRAQFIGRTCDQCKAGHGNLTAGCPPCSCDSIGAASKMCDPVTGQCNCQRGVMGVHCNLCEPEHFGFSPTGCEKTAWCVPETPPTGMGDGSVVPVRRRRRRRRKRPADANKGPPKSRTSQKTVSRTRRYGVTERLDPGTVDAGEDGGDADAEADAGDGDADATTNAIEPAVETAMYNSQNRAHVVTAARAATAADNAICAATNAVVAASGAASDAAAAANAYASGFFCFNNPRARPHSVPARPPPPPPPPPLLTAGANEQQPYMNQYRYPHRYNSVCRPTTS